MSVLDGLDWLVRALFVVALGYAAAPYLTAWIR